jgi:hypothetical protein
MPFDFWSKRASGLLLIPDRLRNVDHEAAKKKIQVFFWVGEVWRGRENLPMKRGPEDHIPRVSMKFSLIASSGTHIQQLVDFGLPWDLAINGYCSLARRAWDEMFSFEMGSPYLD